MASSRSLAQENPKVTIAVNAAAGKHAISPLIYGVCMATGDQVSGLRAPLNRFGGNSSSTYNWKNNTNGSGNDWYFESFPGLQWLAPPAGNGMNAAARPDQIFADTKAAGGQAMITVPMVGWVAKSIDSNTILAGYSVAKYGPQQKTDPQHTDAGNGVKVDGTKITNNDPSDAAIPADVAYQRGFVEHLVGKWGKASAGGVHYYILDNEPGLWASTHQDVHPKAETSQEYLDDAIAYGTMVKSVDPAAMVIGPEEWGWPAYLDSEAGNDYAAAHGYTKDTPERRARGGMDNLPWFLMKLKEHDDKTKVKTIDYFTVHIYPQGGDGGDDVSEKIEQLRNRSTRALWDPNYVDESWINKPVHLIPMMKDWVKTYYPGMKIGITEYNWGAEKSISGATAQADILGIFGREGLDLATRWIAPDPSTLVYKAMQMYRNYDGKGGAFGSIGVSDTPTSNPDDLSSFASMRSSDGALTVMVVNKVLSGETPVVMSLAGFKPKGAAQVWQLTSSNTIARLSDVTPAKDGSIAASLPAQSVTLFVVPRR